ncbi:UNVERIFIED_CONTAM: 60S ribosomal protein L16, mitochondrial [Sesamum calycinum]|uniref:Large ribosomal subunit protein uL16m n=1 Tax=Sesamum calycinum TaxID=2727403 RepID=A0AAW2K100_9LAMI
MSGQFRRNGKIWVRVLADIPITGKPTEVRMGRGKGNPTGWIARVSTGQILFEMDGVSLSNARQAATLAAHKLCSSTKFVQWSKRRSTIGCSLLDLSSQEGEAPSNGRKGEWLYLSSMLSIEKFFLVLMLSFSVPRREIDVMIPESCDMDSAVNGFIMLLIGKNADEECVEKRHKTLGGVLFPLEKWRTLILSKNSLST